MRAHRPRREVPLDAGHQVPVGHHLTQMLGPVIGVVQYPPRPDDTPGVRSRLDCRARLRAAFKVVFRVACLVLLCSFFCAPGRPRPVSCTRGGVGSFLIVCTGLDLGGSIPMALILAVVDHLIDPLVP